MQRLSVRLVLVLASACVAHAAVAQIDPGGGGSGGGGVPTWVEYGKRIEATQRISALENGFAGESVSLYNGATSFSVTDIDVPGNSALPVRLVRRLAIELQPQDEIQPYDSLLHGAGNWEVEVPYMAATYPASMGWNANRCSGGSVPPTTMGPNGIFWRVEVWQGISIHVPGRGDATALGLNSQVPVPSTGGPYRLTTTNRDMFDCIPMKAGLSGEGFRMTTTSGVRYYFDVGTTRAAAKLVKQIKPSGQLPFPVYLERNRYYLLASKIEDRFGNTVQFQYDASGHPTRIWSSDGRAITLVYSNGRLTSAISHGSTWQYQYDGSGNLVAVVLPDTSRWQYAYTGTLMPSAPPPIYNLFKPWCQGTYSIIDDVFTLTATHPGGAKASFQFENKRHYRSGVHASECAQVGDPSDPSYDLLVPYYYDVMSLTQKTLSGPGLQSATWNYSYSGFAQLWGDHSQPPSYPCTTCTQSKTTTVTNPDGTSQRYLFGMVYQLNDGRLLQTDTLRADGSVIRTEASTYLSDAGAANQPFYGQYGNVLGSAADPLTARVRPVVQTVTTEDGATFTTTVNNFDGYARVAKQTQSSSLGYSRIVEASYYDHVGKWVLGQVALRKINGISADSTTYDAATALPLTYSHFGKLKQILAWNADGTLASVKDGNNHTTTLSNWKRGIPQSVGYADGTSESAGVNDAGWIAWVKDENGYTTNYGYDAMGRLASITYPSGDDVAWNQTLLSFASVGSSEYGIPAGHWKQTIHTGNGYAVTYFDAMWRPLVSERYDSANKSATLSQTVNRYDAMGRKVFTSWPMNNLGSYAAANSGIHTTFDALNRVTKVQQDSELGLLTTTTQYLSGFQTRVTDPRGYATTTTYQAWGEPNTDYPDGVTAPEGQITVIMRDGFGKPLSITRTGVAQGSPQITRYYVYDGYQQLCKRIDPETGATAFGYDAAGNLSWSAAGLNLPGTTTCDASAAYGSGRRADRTYDARNRMTGLTFPDGIGNQSWVYSPDGLPRQVTTNNANGGSQVVNAYLYDKRRLLTSESVSQPGWYTWALGYGYDANGHLASMVYPSGLTVAFAPNALGQPTQVGGYATGAHYSPDGSLAGFTYGNGIVRSVTRNVRGLPSAINDSGGGVTALAQNYGYDAGGNPTTWNDAANSAQNRSMTYDGLARLSGMNAAALGGTSSYGYDVLDNLRTRVRGGATTSFNYDVNNNRLISMSVPGQPTLGLTWDAQGNLTAKGGQGYSFDYGNRLRYVNGRESYRYDGLGRRVLAWSWQLNQNILSMYDRAGQLVHQYNEREAGLQHDPLYLGSQLVAIVDTTLGGQRSVRYQHTDAEGTVVAQTNAGRAILSRSVYDSYGATQDHGNDDGPGYTGHVQDSLTGLTYMQQRYYDPGLMRFVSADPVDVDAATGGNFNRYWYAKDNPYRYTDPDGRKVVFAEGVPEDFKKNFAKAIKYLNTKHAAANFAKLQKSKLVFVVKPAADRTNGYQTVYNAKTNTITWADKGGVKVMDSRTGKLEPMSPAMAVGHEAQHGIDDLQGTFFKDNSTKDAQFQTKEERKVITGYENNAAKKLGEPIRTDHYGHGEVTCTKVTQC